MVRKALVVIMLTIPVLAVAQSAVRGIVVDDEGKPLPGVEFWTGRFLTKDGGIVSYLGIIEKKVTGPNGRFACSYGGSGRDEVAISIAFQHPDYAPTWVESKRAGDGPLTVTLDKGIELNGVAAVNGTRDQHSGQSDLFQWPLQVRLDCSNGMVSELPWRLEADTTSTGAFVFHIPTDYAQCEFDLFFAGTRIPLKLEANKPLPVVQIHTEVSIELDRKSAAADSIRSSEPEELASAK